MVLDFTDAGLASTYAVPTAELERVFGVLVSQASVRGADIVIAEIADGLFQPESAALLHSVLVKDGVDGALFAASEPMGAAAGAQWLEREGYRVLGISGRLCLSPLFVREVVQEIGIPVLPPEELELPEVAGALLPSIKARSTG